jgi:hypothetical protein
VFQHLLRDLKEAINLSCILVMNVIKRKTITFPFPLSDQSDERERSNLGVTACHSLFSSNTTSVSGAGKFLSTLNEGKLCQTVRMKLFE